MDPPATISAPEATDPMIVTSPSGKITDCPDRTGSFMMIDGITRICAPPEEFANVPEGWLFPEDGSFAAFGAGAWKSAADFPPFMAGGIPGASSEGRAPSIPMSDTPRLASSSIRSVSSARSVCRFSTSRTIGLPKKKPAERDARSSSRANGQWVLQAQAQGQERSGL